jgi:cytochrome c oxidase cbb3-type subunit 3
VIISVQPLKKATILCLLVSLTFVAAALYAQQGRPPRQRPDVGAFLGLGSPPDQAAAKKGEGLFKQNCAACHGENARGAEGPNLLRSVVVLHDENGDAVGQVLKTGRPQGGMPAFPNLTKDEVYQIAEYLHQQIYLAANRGLYREEYAGERSHSSGNAAAGKAFFADHCASCHSVSGDLAHIGSRYPEVDVLQSRFLWPKSDKPRCATVVTSSGAKITGNVARLDDFDVAIFDAGGEYHYWPRSAVKISLDDPLKPHGELLPQYTDADIHNLAAYLLTIK